MKSDRTKSEESVGKANSPQHAWHGEDAGIDPNLQLIRLFNHYRHDWMNEIQLLYGYIKLKKYDKLESLMEKIKEKVQQEGFVSKLGNSELIVFLLSFQAEVKDLQLIIEMEREVHLNELKLDSPGLGKLLMALIGAFKENAVLYADGEPVLLVKLVEESERLLIHLQYHGGIAADLAADLEEATLKSIQKVNWDIMLLDEYQAAMHIEVPFYT